MIGILGIVAILLAVVMLVIGIVFIQQGFSKEAFLIDAMEQEQITASSVHGIVDNAAKAQAVVISSGNIDMASRLPTVISLGKADSTRLTPLS